MFELSALQDQRLQLPELLTYQTNYFVTFACSVRWDPHERRAAEHVHTTILAGITGDVLYFLPGMTRGYVT